MSQPLAYPALTPEEVIALRRTTTAHSTTPWSDTLAFADALFKALAARMQAGQEAPVNWDALEALGWQRLQCGGCGELAMAAPYPSPSLQENALRYVQLRKLATVDMTETGLAFSFAGLQPADGAGRGSAGEQLDAVVDASMNRGKASLVSRLGGGQ